MKIVSLVSAWSGVLFHLNLIMKLNFSHTFRPNRERYLYVCEWKKKKLKRIFAPITIFIYLEVFLRKIYCSFHIRCYLCHLKQKNFENALKWPLGKWMALFFSPLIQICDYKYFNWNWNSVPYIFFKQNHRFLKQVAQLHIYLCMLTLNLSLWIHLTPLLF